MRNLRILSFFVFVAIFSLTFALASEVQLTEDEVTEIIEEFDEITEGIDGAGIFIHNVSLALPMFIPGFGIFWGLFAAFSTGVAFSAMKSAIPLLDQIPSLSILFMSPFGLMELTAYSIAMSRSYILIHKIIKKMSIRPDIRVICLEVAILVALLLAGGFLEYFMIESMSGFDSGMID
jgi:hypothetical protein